MRSGGARRRAPGRAAEGARGARRDAAARALGPRRRPHRPRPRAAGAVGARGAAVLPRLPPTGREPGRLRRERRAADRGARPARRARVHGAATRGGPGRRGHARPHAGRSRGRAGARRDARPPGPRAPPAIRPRVPLDADPGRHHGLVTLPRKVAVIGAGDIGSGWAALCASAGWPVTLFDSNTRILERALTEVPRRARALVALERAPQGVVESVLGGSTRAGARRPPRRYP